MTAPPPVPRAAAGGLCAALACVAAKCVATLDPFPIWSGDPFISDQPVLGLTPWLAFAIDAAQSLASGVALVGLARIGRRVPTWQVCSFAVAFAAANAHCVPRQLHALDNALVCAEWFSGLLAAFAVSAAASVPRLRAIAAGVLVGLAMMIAAKGMFQVAVEHPQTLANFRATRSEFFASMGWTEDSPMALSYTRRIEQAEASGWFGFANVFATLAAASLVLLSGLCVAAWREERRAALLLGAGAVASGASLLLAGAKGGYAAAALGLAALCAAWVIRRRRGGRPMPNVLAQVFGPGVVVAALTAVALRGAIGERTGELSVLFRWFYLQAATRIFAEHPLVGVGPAGFKDAYLGAKNPLSPEEVSSPHSILFDWGAALGLGGLLLCATWIAWASRAGRTLVEGAHAPTDGEGWDARRDRLIIAVVLMLPTALAGFLEREAAMLETSLMRIAGIVAGVAVAGACARAIAVGLRSMMVALGAAAVVAIAHLQIELTGTVAGAGAWCFSLIGLAAGVATPAAQPGKPRHGRGAPMHLVAVAVALGCGAWAVAAWRWERALRDAAAPVAAWRDLQTRRDLLAAGIRVAGSEPDSLPVLARDVGAAPTPAAVDAKLAEMHARAARTAAEQLAAAQRAVPTHFGTLRARSRVELMRSQNPAANGSTDTAFAVMDEHRRRFGKVASYWAWLAVMHESAAMWTADPLRRSSHQCSALAAYEAAAALSPYDWMPAAKASDIAAAAGQAAVAGRWAAEAIRRSGLRRLDPLTALPEAKQVELKQRTR
ncbi:MAG TPA: O-antigen ligase family protein [Phycisphaerales bacterium]|nr:O-antigen ligase family protein [Phycisphaerales bacterium]